MGNAPTLTPSMSPSMSLKTEPTNAPTLTSSMSPSMSLTTEPTNAPTLTPSMSPTKSPTTEPTNVLTLTPSMSSTKSPTISMSHYNYDLRAVQLVTYLFPCLIIYCELSGFRPDRIYFNDDDNEKTDYIPFLFKVSSKRLCKVTVILK